MEKPCCSSCWLGVTENEYRSYSNTCKNPYCKCHLPKEKCECACHENKLGKPYAHDTKCCEEMNGAVKPPTPEKGDSPPLLKGKWRSVGNDSSAPEKKWEEAFDEEFGRMHHTDDSSDGLRGNATRKNIKSFIRQLLEEKAVEVEGKKLVKNPNKKIPEDVEAHIIAHNLAIDEAAAILRR